MSLRNVFSGLTLKQIDVVGNTFLSISQFPLSLGHSVEIRGLIRVERFIYYLVIRVIGKWGITK